MQERIALFLDYDTGVLKAKALANRYGVSRETFFVWKRRCRLGCEPSREKLARTLLQKPLEPHADVGPAAVARRAVAEFAKA